MKEIDIEVITPARVVYKGKANSVTIPGTKGSFQVLFNHAPLMSTFEIGVVKIEESQGNILKFATGGGSVEVLNNKVLLLAESFENPDEIDIDRAKRAMERAKERLKRKNVPDGVDVSRAELALRRAVNRLKLTGDY